MAASIAAILGELREIERRSPEDVAVLMTPLLRALEAVANGRDPQLDHAQAMAIANSLAQTAAQAGDVHVAVAIATVSAELEQLPPATFAGTATDTRPAPADTGPDASVPPPLGPFANPYQQLLGILGICALSYSGYLEIQARFQPGSVAGWLLTGSSSLFALAVALAWRRFVLRRRRGPALTATALIFAALAAGWTVQTGLTLRPQMAGNREPGPVPAGAERTPGAAAQAAGAAEGADDEGQSRTPDQTPLPDPAPIAFWWLGGSSEPTSTRIPAETRTMAAENAAATEPQAEAPDTAGTRTDADARADHPETATATTPAAPAPRPQPAADRMQAAPPAGSAQAQTPLARYRGLLQRQVVVTDAKGMRHEGKLTGISKHGLTLLMEVELFGKPIVAQRFYLFDNIENLHAK